MCDNNCSVCGKCPITVPHEQTEFNYNYEEYSRPTTVLLGVTNRCNLSCPYCFVAQDKQDMSFETAEKAVQMVLKNAEITGGDPSVLFFGGEPLIMFDKIIVPLIEKYDGQVKSWGLTTNGILLDEDKVDFFYKRGIMPLLSFDGVKEVQNIQRPGKGFSSYDTFMNNLPYILLRFPETTIRMTVTKESIPYLYESYMMFDELGVMNVTCAPDQFEDWTDDDAILYRDQVDLIGHHMYTSVIKGKEVTKFKPLTDYVQGVWRVFYAGGLKFNNSMKRCGLGVTTCSVTPKGSIIPCQEHISKPSFIIGHVDLYQGIDEVSHKNFLTWYWDHINSLKCDKNCPEYIREACVSDTCPVILEDRGFHIPETNCVIKRRLWEVAHRIFTLTYGSIYPNVRDFFYGGCDEACY